MRFSIALTPASLTEQHKQPFRSSIHSSQMGTISFVAAVAVVVVVGVVVVVVAIEEEAVVGDDEASEEGSRL